MAKKVSRKDQIEEKATVMFEDRGFSATSMRDLATALDIEASSLYAHIHSKEELLRNICFRMADSFFDALQSVEAGSLTATEKLRSAITAHVKVITNNPSASAVFFSEWRHLTEPALTKFLEMRHDYEKRFLKILEDGERDEIFQIPDKKLTVLMLLSSLNWIHRWYNPNGPMSPDDIGENLATLLLEGIKRRETEFIQDFENNV